MSDASPSPPRVLADAEARRRIREDLGATLIVEAAAGTGKTTMLVARIVAVLRSGVTTLDRVVSVTFTEKAAGEMKLRLRAVLEKERHAAAATPAERAHLDAALAQLEVAKIGTIHALCGDLLREQPVEARVDPLFEVLSEDDAERLFDLAFERWFQETLAAPGEGVRRMLRRRPRGRDRLGPRDLLRDAAWKLVGHRDFPGRWRRDGFARDGFIDRLLAQMTALSTFAGRADRAEDWLGKNVEKISLFLEELGRREAVRGRDHDGLEAELAEVARWKEWKYTGGRSAMYGRGIKRVDVRDQRDALKAELDTFAGLAGADLAACLQDELAPLGERYVALKRRAGKLDFLDLLLGARDLVRDDHQVRAALQRRTTHLFVDEFQDTDPLQAEILLLLAADDPAERDFTRANPVPGKLFLVGDPKQSIYRFRRADVALYQAVKERLLASGASLLHLVTSFRSAPSIQRALNAAFAPVMKGNADRSQADYVALEPFRPEIEGQPTIVALPVPKPYSSFGKVTSWAIDESSPHAVGAFVDWLIRQSGYRVSERDGDGLVPVEPRHICLLFKRLQSFGADATRGYVRALEARRIPHVLVGGRSFHDREEVLAVENALAAIEWPADEMSVYATLHGPFFAISDEALLAWRGAARPLTPLRKTEDAELTELTRPIAEALTILRRLHLGRNQRPIADTLARFLEATRAHAGVAIWPTGEQSLANVLRVMDMARRFESAGATSFRAFVERLEEDAASGQAGEAPVVEEGTEGVRIMTAHRSKGLEFPVVILADPTTPTLQGNPPQPSRLVDNALGLWAEPIAGLVPAELAAAKDSVLRRDREEAARLTYVAATRARDLLVIPTCGDEELEGWLDVLNPVLYPPRESWREAREAPGCPAFGEDSVLERQASSWGSGERGSWSAVMPGLHTPRAAKGDLSALSVVWWDPAILDLDREPEGGLRQQRILSADDPQLSLGGTGRAATGRVGDGKAAHDAWRARREEALVAASVPTLEVTKATAAALDPELGGGETGALVSAIAARVVVERTDAEREGRPRGRRFGTLVHAVLADVDLDADEEAVRTLARARARLVDAQPAETDAAVVAVVAALRHPIFARARAAKTYRREVPILLTLGPKSVVEGVIDLCFQDASPGASAVWVVIDFKTDHDLEGSLEAYARQVALYALAITRATGEEATGALLCV